jgi:hypothetical protein
MKDRSRKYFLVFLIGLPIIVAIGLLSYAVHPKKTDLVCKDFNGFRRIENGDNIKWHIDSMRVTLINNVSSINQFDKYMGAFLVDSTTSASIFKNTDLRDAKLEPSKVLSIFVPTPQSNVGMLLMTIDMVTGDANISTWRFAGDEGNGILKGKCNLKEQGVFDKVLSRLGELSVLNPILDLFSYS